MNKMWRFACLLGLASSVYSQLTLTGVKCGQLTCALGEYCSPETSRCASCADVCNSSHHNYDSGFCVKECQGYIHDLRYGTRGHEDPTDFKSVQQQARVALIISIVALAVLVAILVIKCISLFRDHRGKFTLTTLRQKLHLSKSKVKQYPMDLTHHNPHADLAKPKHELKLELRESIRVPPKRPERNNQPLNVRDLDTRTSQTDKSQGATTPKTVSTSLSHRHPAEDTTLDNPYTYDNMGMNVTPPPKTSASHTNF